MKTKDAERRIEERPLTAPPGLAADDHRHYHETSRVFHCMQCEIQLQIDIAVLRREASTEIEEGIVHVRLDPRINLEQA